MKQTLFLANTLVALSTCGFAGESEDGSNFTVQPKVEMNSFTVPPEAQLDSKEVAFYDAMFSDGPFVSDGQIESEDSTSKDQDKSEVFYYDKKEPSKAVATSTSSVPSSVIVFLEGAFTYWYASEDGLQIANKGALANSGDLFLAENGNTLSQSFSYNPGFQVAFGVIGKDEWLVKAEYTWYRGTTHTTGAALSGTVLTSGTDAATAPSGTSVWAIDDWFLQASSTGQALSGSQAWSTWHLAMDVGDAVIGRPFYKGRMITLSPFAGLRTLWIRQSMDVSLIANPINYPGGAIVNQPIHSRNSSNSWSIGGIVGCESQFRLPYGIRFEGDASASLLYTQYTSINHEEDVASTTFNQFPYTTSMTNYTAVRPAAEVGLGMGWNKKIGKGNCRFDLSADYSYMVFWSQNMFRTLIDHSLSGAGSTPGDLSLHGLTITARVDF